ncbi:metalloprotease [Mycena vulgaris]|nr:metalloprotease [Mycena vulgaris]
MYFALFALFFADVSVASGLNVHAERSVPGTHFPSSSYQTFPSGLHHPLYKRDDLGHSATAFVQSQLNIDLSNVKFKSGYSDDIAEYAYVKQQHNNIPFANAVANVAFTKGKIVSFGNSFVKPETIASSTPTVSVTAAISTAEMALGGTYNNIPTTLEYLVEPDNSVALAHTIQIQNREAKTWYEAFVDAHSGKFISSINLVSNAAYRALPIYKTDPLEGLELIVDPQDYLVSPLGWHNNGTSVSNDTSGNNVQAFVDLAVSNTTAQSSPNLIFNYTQDPDLAPGEGTNLDAARTNAFYVINTMHDITYRYGFTESAFNFQQTNTEGAGVGGDAVLASVQNTNGTDDAFFITLPEGQPGIMVLFLWFQSKPARDSALANDIMVHEYTHGITNRMTGGGTGRCLQVPESGGMGEGWSDAFSDWMAQLESPIKDFTIGGWVDGGTPLRRFPYSTNLTTNPYTYSALTNLTELHGIGTVWANILHNMLATLVDAHGFSKTARTNAYGTEGNVVFMHLFIDALALQPCQPDFIQGRDAIILADHNRYSGTNRCLLWKVFASRGLGVAAVDHTDDFTVPDGC